MPDLPFTDSRYNLFPILFYSPDTRFGLGAGSWLILRAPEDGADTKPDNLWLSAVYTQERQTIVQVIPEVFLGDDGSRLLVHLRYVNFPARFFGIGNDTRREDAETYTARTRWVRAVLTMGLRGALSAGPVLDYDHTEVHRPQSGGILEQGDVPGAEGSRIGALGFALRWDSREQVFAPRQGAMLDLTVLRHEDLDDDRYRFSSVRADGRWYLPLAEAQTLALQALIWNVAGGAPFNALPRLGGKFLFRGYLEGRYRDRQLLALQAEHRVELLGRWGAVAFLSYGAVAPDQDAFALRDFKWAGGAGLRWAYNRPERIQIRLDVAVSDEEPAFYLSMGEAF